MQNDNEKGKLGQHIILDIIFEKCGEILLECDVAPRLGLISLVQVILPLHLATFDYFYSSLGLDYYLKYSYNTLLVHVPPSCVNHDLLISQVQLTLSYNYTEYDVCATTVPFRMILHMK